MSTASIPIVFCRHKYRLEVIDGPEKGRCIYTVSFDRALKDARDLLFYTGSKSRILNHLTEEVLWESGVERLQG